MSTSSSHSATSPASTRTSRISVRSYRGRGYDTTDKSEVWIDACWAPTVTDEATADRTRLHKLLAESFAVRPRADVLVGAFLSGNLDFSTIFVMMRAVGGDDRPDLQALSIGFNIEAYSGPAFAETVAERLGTTHTSPTMTAADVRDHMDDITGAMDQPKVDGVNIYIL